MYKVKSTLFTVDRLFRLGNERVAGLAEVRRSRRPRVGGEEALGVRARHHDVGEGAADAGVLPVAQVAAVLDGGRAGEGRVGQVDAQTATDWPGPSAAG